MSAAHPAAPAAGRSGRIPYKWSVLSNTTLGMLLAMVNASIVIISLPAIFTGIHLDPLAPGNVSYLLWMLMGYMLVTAVLVVTLGRLGDMYGRVRVYRVGFVVFTAASVALAVGACWAYRNLNETAVTRHGVRLDWWGNLTLAIGLTALLAAITYGIQPYGGRTEGWTNPWVIAGVIGGIALLVVFCLIETRVSQPMFDLGLFRIPAFWAGNVAALLNAVARGGLQFVLIIWLQGIWLPLHGYNFAETPLWAGIYLLPLTLGFIAAGPVSGHLSDRYGAKVFATGGLVIMTLSFIGLLLIPVDFSYPVFAVLLLLNGVGSGLFAAPNTTAVMNAVPAAERGVASGIRATFQNAGMVLSIGVFFSLLVAGLSRTLPSALHTGLAAEGVPAPAVAAVIAAPPVSLLFAAFLGANPITSLLNSTGVLHHLPPSAVATLTSRTYFPHLLSGPFHDGLVVVFVSAAVVAAIGAVVSLFRGGVYIHDEHCHDEEIRVESDCG